MYTQALVIEALKIHTALMWTARSFVLTFNIIKNSASFTTKLNGDQICEKVPFPHI